MTQDRSERRRMPVGDGSRREFEVEKIANNRFIFTGPLPGRVMFWSGEASSFEDAAAQARMRWHKMDRVRRDAWYGTDGRYTRGQA